MIADCFMAVDIGTGSTRAALITGEGRLLAQASQEYPLDTPAPGWAEQDPRIWWRCTVETIRRVLDESEITPRRIACVGIDSQMHATIPLDASGDVLVPAVQIWCDKRAAGIVETFRSAPDAPKWSAQAANPPTTSWWGFKIKWLQEQHPDVYARTWKFTTGAAFAVHRLTGALVMSRSEASGSFCMDTRSGDWSPGLIERLGLDLAKLPPIAPATSLAGHVTPEAARLTGLAAGTPVAVGAADFPTTLLAAGVIAPGDAVDISGTSCLMALLASQPATDPRLMNLRHETDGWVSYGVVEAGGGSLRWFRDLCCGQEIAEAREAGRNVYDVLTEPAGRVAPGAGGLLFFPYLLGERTMGSPHSRGVFFGLTPNSDRPTMTRAILEGITFELRRVLRTAERAGAPVGKVRVIGGGAANAVWNQIRADIYGKTVVQYAANEGGILGTVMLAGLAVGFWPDAQAAVNALTSIDTEYEPDAGRAAGYDALYEEFTRLHDLFIPSFERLQQQAALALDAQ